MISRIAEIVEKTGIDNSGIEIRQSNKDVVVIIDLYQYVEDNAIAQIAKIVKAIRKLNNSEIIFEFVGEEILAFRPVYAKLHAAEYLGRSNSDFDVEEYGGAVESILISIKIFEPFTSVEIEKLKQFIEDWYTGLSFEIASISISTEIYIHSLRETLTALKILSPASLEEICDNLGAKQPEQKRKIKLHLENARKKELILFTSQFKYVMTNLGLSYVPITLDRSSSDVRRMLHLARRKW